MVEEDRSDTDTEELREDWSSEELETRNNGGDEGVSGYENQRLSRIRENMARLEALGLPKLASSLLGSVKKQPKRKGKEKKDEDDEYRPSDGEDRVSSSSEEDTEEEDWKVKDDGSSGSRRATACKESPISGWRCSWKPALKAYHKSSPALRMELGRTGFGSFLGIPRMQSDRKLISAVCERWFGETNTFHFPCCELAITPLDFVMLTGIPIEGEVIPVLPPVDMPRAAYLMGVSPEHLEVSHAWVTGRVKLAWLSEYFRDTDISSVGFDSPSFVGVFRRLFLYILGACFFMTDHSMVDAGFLELMDLIDRISTFDWGGAIYSSILSGLRRVARGEGHSICFFYPIIEMWSHEYLDPFRPKLKVSDETSFPRSSRWSAPSFRVDRHLIEKAREELDRLTLTSVTLRPFSRLKYGVMAQARGVERFMGRRVAFSCLGESEYFLGERVYHQFTGEFRIPYDPPVMMTAAWTRDASMEEMRTRGVPVDSLVGGVTDYSSYRAWFRSVSIGPIMRPFSLRPGATEVGGHLVEGYFQMESLLSVLEENIRGVTDENVRLRTRFLNFEDPETTLCEVPPFQMELARKFFKDGRPLDLEGLKKCMRRGYSYIDGVEALLCALKNNNYEMHAFTNYPSWYTMIEDKLKISTYLSWTFCSCITGKRKPGADSYLEVLRHLGVEPASCIFIDDRMANVEAAVNAGIVGLHFKDAASLQQDLSLLGIDTSSTEEKCGNEDLAKLTNDHLP